MNAKWNLIEVSETKKKKKKKFLVLLSVNALPAAFDPQEVFCAPSRVMSSSSRLQ